MRATWYMLIIIACTAMMHAMNNDLVEIGEMGEMVQDLEHYPLFPNFNTLDESPIVFYTDTDLMVTSSQFAAQQSAFTLTNAPIQHNTLVPSPQPKSTHILATTEKGSSSPKSIGTVQHTNNVEYIICGFCHEKIVHELFHVHWKDKHDPTLFLPNSAIRYCLVCNEACPSPDAFNIHYKSQHFQDSRYICADPTCTNAYESPKAMVYHFFQYHPKRILPRCPHQECLSSKAFTALKDWLEHNAKKHEKK